MKWIDQLVFWDGFRDLVVTALSVPRVLRHAVSLYRQALPCLALQAIAVLLFHSARKPNHTDQERAGLLVGGLMSLVVLGVIARSIPNKEA
jgi:hypothetical protein